MPGPSLVLLNGFAATKDDWDPGFLEALADGHEVVRLDNRGMGESEWDGRPFGVANLAEDVAGAIEGHGLERPLVAGWSMGGCIALRLAIDRPDLVGGLVLLATFAGGGLMTRPDPAVLDRLADTSPPPREQASELISLLFPAPRAAGIDAAFGDLVAQARAGLDPALVAAQRAAMEAWEAEEIRARLDKIDCPALVATGREDAVIPPRNSDALAAAIPGAWLARLPRCGHGFVADHPRAIARLIGALELSAR